MFLRDVQFNKRTALVWSISYVVALIVTWSFINEPNLWSYLQPISMAATFSVSSLYFASMHFLNDPGSERLQGSAHVGLSNTFLVFIPCLISLATFVQIANLGVRGIGEVRLNFVAFLLAVSFLVGDLVTARGQKRTSDMNYAKLIWSIAYLDGPIMVSVGAVLAISLFASSGVSSEIQGWSVGATAFQLLAQNLGYGIAESLRISPEPRLSSVASFIPTASTDRARQLGEDIFVRIGALPASVPEKLHDLSLWIIRHQLMVIENGLARATKRKGFRVNSDDQIELSMELMSKYKTVSFLDPAMPENIKSDWTAGWFRLLEYARNANIPVKYYFIIDVSLLRQRESAISDLLELAKSTTMEIFLVSKEELVSNRGVQDLNWGAIEYYPDGVTLKYWSPSGKWTDMRNFPLRVLDYELDPGLRRLIDACERYGRLLEAM